MYSASRVSPGRPASVLEAPEAQALEEAKRREVMEMEES